MYVIVKLDAKDDNFFISLYKRNITGFKSSKIVKAERGAKEHKVACSEEKATTISTLAQHIIYKKKVYKKMRL